MVVKVAVPKVHGSFYERVKEEWLGSIENKML